MDEHGGPARRYLFWAALALGVAVRLGSLTLPGTSDFGIWKIWSYNAAIENPAGLYGATEWRSLQFDGAEGPLTYPPLAIYDLAVAGRAYRQLHGGEFPNTAGLTIALKGLILAFDAALGLLIYLGLRRYSGAVARWATLAYWLNPSMVLASNMLGYLDVLAMLPALGAVLAAAGGWPVLSGALIAAATLTKPQCVLLIPALLLAVVNRRDARYRLTEGTAFAGGGLLASAVLVGPVVAAGNLSTLTLAMSRFAHHDMLSGNATNLWWIIGYVLRVRYSLDMGTWNAITMEPRILAISRVVELGYPNPRVVGTLIAIAAMLWALWAARRVRDRFLLSALGAFLIHAYATLAAQVHENHLFAAIPLLAVAAARYRRHRPLLWVLTAIFALNLNLFYGISESEWRGAYMVPRSSSVLDLTVWLSLANCAALVWHARLLKRESSAGGSD